MFPRFLIIPTTQGRQKIPSSRRGPGLAFPRVSPSPLVGEGRGEGPKLAQRGLRTSRVLYV
jgi:hypothetical protein